MKTGMRQLMNALSIAANLGFAMAVNTVVGIFIGRMIDDWLHTSPWGVAFGTLMGLIAGLRSVYHRVTTTFTDKNDEAEEDTPKSTDREKGNK